MRFFLPVIGLFVLAGSRLFAEGFDRPIPQAQSATAEHWYALASLTLILSMVAVQWLVARR